MLHNRPGDHCGGCLAVIHKNHIPIKELENGNTPAIEYAVWKAKVHNKTIHLMGMYHPPPSSINKTMTGMFIDEMTDLLTDKIPKYSNLVMLGDLTSVQKMYKIQAWSSSMTQWQLLAYNSRFKGQLQNGKQVRFNLYTT